MTKNIFKHIQSSSIISGLPAYHHSSDLHNFGDKYSHRDKKFYESLKVVVDSLLDIENQNASRYIFLCGIPGCGKTHFMVGLYKALVAKLGYIQGDGAFFTTFANLSQEI